MQELIPVEEPNAPMSAAKDSSVWRWLPGMGRMRVATDTAGDAPIRDRRYNQHRCKASRMTI